MKKFLYSLLFILLTIGLTACTSTLEASQIQIISSSSNEVVNQVTLFSGDVESYEIDFTKEINLVEARATSSSSCISIISTQNGFQVTALEEGTGTIHISIKSTNHHDYTMILPVQVSLHDLTILFSHESEKFLGDSTPLTESDLETAMLHDSTKAFLLSQLERGKKLTFSDLVEDKNIVNVTDESIETTLDYLTLLAFTSHEEVTYTLSTEHSDVLAIMEYDNGYGIYPLKEGTATLLITMEQEHYEPVKRNVTVTIKPPSPRLYLFDSTQEIGIGEIATYEYFVYPENTTVNVTSKDIELCTAQISGNKIFVTGIATGYGELTLQATSASMEPSTEQFAVTITPPKALLELSSNSIKNNEIHVYCDYQELIQLNKRSNTELTVTYDASNITTEDNGNSMGITVHKEGSYEMSFLATEDGYANNKQTYTIIASQAPVDLSISSTNVTVVGTQSTQVTVSSNTPSASIAINATDGVKTSYSGNTLAISATKNGTITVVATESNHKTTTKTIEVVYGKESVLFSNVPTTASITGTESKSMTISTNVDTPTLTVNTTNGVTASYNSSTKSLTYSASQSGTITLSAAKDGYNSATHTIAVTYTMPALSLSVSSTSLTIQGTNQQLVNVSVDSDAIVSITPSSSVNASYNSSNQTITITASSSGTISITATKSGYSNATTSIAVTYQSSADASAYAAQVVALVNQERVNAGLSELSVSSGLSTGAMIRAEELVTSFSHARPDGSSWTTVSSEASGENIAKGQANPTSVMSSWMNSSGHKANILNSNFTKIGVGVYYDNGTYYWVQLFGY